MSQNGAGGGPASGSPLEMIKPQHIAAIPILSDADKAKYQAGLEKLWTTANTNPPESEIHQKAIARIKEVSKDLMHRLARSKTNQRAQMGGQAAQQQRPQGAPQQQPQQQQPAQSQAPPQIAQPVQQQAPAQPQSQMTMQMPQTQQAANPAQASAQQQAQQKPAQQPGQQAQAQAANRLSATAEKFLREFDVFPPQNIMPNTPEHSAHKQKTLAMLHKCLTLSDRWSPVAKDFVAREAAATAAGQTLTPDQTANYAKVKQTIGTARAEFDRIKAENERNKQYWMARRASMAAGGENAHQASTPGQSQAQAQQMRAMSTSQSNQDAQQTNSQMSFSGQQNAQQHPQQIAQQQPQPSQQASQQIQQPPPRPQPAPQQYPPGQQGPPHSLSHQAAISAINRTYSDAPASAPSLQRQGTGTPTSAGPTPAAAFNPTQPPQQTMGGASIASAKMPIPQKLETPPVQPVQMAPARPTLGAGPQGLLGQPGFQKPPGFTLEGEEGRVLSKRKLDELVGQVTGGGEGLSPEAEEALLEEADEFVDTVLTQACRLAKIRPNATLDIRDIQIVLERNFNIRIPGYSLDEVRTVRKFQPAAGWTQKMNAVQAAKVMGKGDN